MFFGFNFKIQWFSEKAKSFHAKISTHSAFSTKYPDTDKLEELMDCIYLKCACLLANSAEERHIRQGMHELGEIEGSRESHGIRSQGSGTHQPNATRC